MISTSNSNKSASLGDIIDDIGDLVTYVNKNDWIDAIKTLCIILAWLGSMWAVFTQNANPDMQAAAATVLTVLGIAAQKILVWERSNSNLAPIVQAMANEIQSLKDQLKTNTAKANVAADVANIAVAAVTKSYAGVVLVDANKCNIDVQAWRNGGGKMINDAATAGLRYITATEGGQTIVIENAGYKADDNTVHCMSQIQDAFVNAFGNLDPQYANPTLDKFKIYGQMLIAPNPLTVILDQISQDKKISMVILEDQVVFGMDGNDIWNGMTQAQKDSFNSTFLSQAYAMESNLDETGKLGKPRKDLLNDAIAFWSRYY